MAPADATPRLGLVVNPIAGLGGRVGLKGTDGPGTAAAALALGARAEAGARAATALQALRSSWPAGRPPPRLLVAPGPMGADAVRAARLEAAWRADVLTTALGDPTTADDTRRCATALVTGGVDLVVFVGGDGTARDVADSLGQDVPVLGVPAGVKIQSATFATSPHAAGELAARWLAGTARRTGLREVLDLDEAAYREGRVAPRLHGYLLVPADRMLQGRKAPSVPDEAAAAASIARDVIGGMVPGRRYVLGPGTTTRAVADLLGHPKTLVGVDVVEMTPDGPRLVAADAGEEGLLEAVAGRPASIVVTPIGGQGFLFGRGNQPISPSVIRAVGRDGIIVVATATKLASLGGRPLLVDTGDGALDRELEGPIRVTTGEREQAVAMIVAA